MARTAQEIVDGILRCIPDSAPEKLVLRNRLDAILRFTAIPHPLYAAPEFFDEQDRERHIKICLA